MSDGGVFTRYPQKLDFQIEPSSIPGSPFFAMSWQENRSRAVVMQFLLLLLIAFICGALAQSLAGYSHGGCLATIALGFIGALLGSWLARVMGLPELLNIRVGDQDFPIIWSIIGGALFSAVIGFLARPRVAE